MPFPLEAEAALRSGAFLAVFALATLWEAAVPRRARAFARRERWPHNLALFALDVALLRLVAPGAAIGVALAAEARGWGLLNALAPPGWLAVLAAMVLLDLAIWAQHVMFHAVPGLWRLHRVHHSDPDVDASTGTRFHPLEILVSAGVKCAAVAAIGAPAVAVLAFELLLNAASVFNHANARIPAALERWLRLIVVTPDMHRVHHSIAYEEANSNFGFSLSWWDRLFGTYRAAPAAGHEAMTLGVAGFHTRAELRLDRLLVQPLRDTPGGGAIERFRERNPEESEA
ncbi:MAG: sterol desaturase family protein [Burkholderiales bacterium]|nr:sterol desaturase family protein [Burkholderiales bacterium]